MKQEDQPYLLGYNHVDFTKYRHPEAHAQKKMKKIHDIHALAIIGMEYFGGAIAVLPDVEQISSIEDLIKCFDSVAQNKSHSVNPADSADPLGASNSPFRD